MSFFIKAGILILNVVYSFLKLLPVEDKIVYISRQDNSIPVDFYLLKLKMQEKIPNYKNVMLVRTIDSGIKAKISYCLHMLRQMYHLATAKVIILDTYCILVSVLKHRDSLCVIQIWHALGALKKFGYSILDKGEGTSSKMASLMKMHKNYTYVFASGEATRPFFSEAFHQPLSKIKVFPLPRLDLLLNKEYQEKRKKEIYARYPFLLNNRKQIVVYAPTFRKQDDVFQKGVKCLVDVIDYESFYLICKPHPLSVLESTDDRVIYDTEFSTEDMLYFADYVITDYSAVIFETLLLKKQLILYAFDIDAYLQERDFYLDYQKVFHEYIADTPTEVTKHLQQEYKSSSAVHEICDQMVARPTVSYTDDICDFIIKSSRL